MELDGAGAGGGGRTAGFVVVVVDDVVAAVLEGLGGAAAFVFLGAGFGFGGSGCLGGSGGPSSWFRKMRRRTMEDRYLAYQRKSPRPVGDPWG